MNFMQFLKSLDDFLYEVMSWLIFYPITMWRTLRHPLTMMNYSDAELHDREERQYTDTLAPPIFLLISLLISQGIELAMVGDNPMIGDTTGLDALVDDETSLLIFRLLTFSIFPLVMAVRLVRKRRIGLNRDTLRPPFYSQCYVAAPFVLVLGLASSFMRTGHPWAIEGSLGAIVGALLWYGALQTRWYMRHLKIGLLAGLWTASVAMVESLAILIAIGLLFS